MAYFSNFPKTIFEMSGTDYIVKDIFRRAMFISEYKPYSNLYTTYTVKDGESAQMIAHEIYGSVDFDWVILVFNEIHDPYFQWPLTQLELERYIDLKYGETKNAVMHYVIGDNIIGESKDWFPDITWVPPDNPGGLSMPVTFYEYEIDLNEKLRTIHILRPELLDDFVSQFNKAINGDLI